MRTAYGTDKGEQHAPSSLRKKKYLENDKIIFEMEIKS